MAKVAQFHVTYETMLHATIFNFPFYSTYGSAKIIQQ